MIYDAFISYRHTPLDMEFAKKVHSGLETFRVPGAVQKKTGKKKIRRVFRDQEELPIGSDLNDNIAKAIRESEYLIVICSPDTPGSYWVAKEIETFVSMHDRQHVLAVLVDGEPEQSFPQMLLTDENGNAVEPLAADVRGATAAERNKKFKTELLRLAAPILGCTYDDLRQRHRERILKRNLMIAAMAAGVIAVAGAAFGVYNAQVASRMKKMADEKAELADEKTMLAGEMTRLASEKTKLADEKTVLADRILAEYREKQINQARFYADEAMLQLQIGNRQDAVLIAVEGLPSADSDRPYVAEAEYALGSALHAYDCDTELDFDRILPHDNVVTQMVSDRTAKYLTVVDEGQIVYVWNCESGERLLKSPAVNVNGNAQRVVYALAGEKGLYVAYEKSLVRYDFNGTETARLTFEKQINACSYSEKYNLICCVSTEAVRIISPDDLSVCSENSFGETGRSVSGCDFSRDGQYAVVAYSNDLIRQSGIFTVNVSSGAANTISVSEEYILEWTVTDGGCVAVAGTRADFFYTRLEEVKLEVCQIADGKKLYDVDVPCADWVMDFSVSMASESYEEYGGMIVIAAEGHVFTYNEATGEQISHATLTDSAADLYVLENSPVAFVSCRNGDIVAVSIMEGKISSQSSEFTGLHIERMEVLNGGISVQIPNYEGVVLMRSLKASDLTEYPEIPYDVTGIAVSPASDYYVLHNRSKGTELDFYDQNGEFLYKEEGQGSVFAFGFNGNSFVSVRPDLIRITDPLKGSVKELTTEDLGLPMNIRSGNLSHDGRYLVIGEQLRGFAVIDLNEGKVVYQNAEQRTASAFTVSGDNRYAIIARGGAATLIVDLKTGAETEAADSALTCLSFTGGKPYLVADYSGQYAALACEDGMVRLFEIPSGNTVLSIPLQTNHICFLGFTKDSKHLLMEGDDHRVKVYDITNGQCLISFDASEKISTMTEDENFIAISDGSSVWLLSAESFGQLAEVQYARVWLPKQKTFVARFGGKMWSIRYKDYQELLLEAERQFPGAKLSMEKRVMYNIE